MSFYDRWTMADLIEFEQWCGADIENVMAGGVGKMRASTGLAWLQARADGETDLPLASWAASVTFADCMEAVERLGVSDEAPLGSREPQGSETG